MRRARVVLAFVCALGAWAVLLAWGVGRAVNDRWLWSQFLAWIPTIAAVLGSGALIIAWRLARTRAHDPGVRAKRSPALIALGAAWCVSAVWLVGEWRVWRVIAPPDADAPTLRIVSLNTGYELIGQFHDRLSPYRPDVLLLTSPNILTKWTELRQSIAEKTYTARLGSLAVVSRYPIRRHGWQPLTITPARWRPPFWPPVLSAAGGEAMFVEIEAPWKRAGGEPDSVIIWYVDLPSDPWLPRREMIAQAAASIGQFRGPVLIRRGDGLDEPGEMMTGFPTPDVIMGDMNTPRGSSALELFSPGVRHAYEQAGRGPSGTYPRLWGLMHIDHALMGRRARAARYDTMDLGQGRHRAQLVDLERLGSP